MGVSNGPLRYELAHLWSKLRQRDTVRFETVRELVVPDPHPLFAVVPGCIENWERPDTALLSGGASLTAPR